MVHTLHDDMNEEPPRHSLVVKAALSTAVEQLREAFDPARVQPVDLARKPVALQGIPDEDIRAAEAAFQNLMARKPIR